MHVLTWFVREVTYYYWLGEGTTGSGCGKSCLQKVKKK